MLKYGAIRTHTSTCCLKRRLNGAGGTKLFVSRRFIWGTQTMSYKHITIPETGEMIVVNDDNSITVPNNPIIPYIEGDGIGVDLSLIHI